MPISNSQTPTAEAEAVKLGAPQIKILSALAETKSPMTYKDIEAKTGYYSSLTKLMRAPHDGSLVTVGYVKEVETGGEGGRKKIAFLITPEGRKALKAAVKPAKKGAAEVLAE